MLRLPTRVFSVLNPFVRAHTAVGAGVRASVPCPRVSTALGGFATGMAGARMLTFSLADSNPIKQKLTSIEAKFDALEQEADTRLQFLQGLKQQVQQLDEALEDWTAQDLSLVATTLWRMGVNANTATVLSRPEFATPVRDVKLLSDIQRFVVLADSTYCGSDEEFSKFVDNVTLVDAVWECSASKYTQSHARMVCHQTKSVVFAIRGSHELSDALLAMYVGSQPYNDGFCHMGVYRAAQKLRPMALEWLQAMMKEHPGYRPVIVGHSLGGATTCILTMLLQPDLPQIHGYAYNAPPTMTQPLAEACKPIVTSVVHGDDCVARVSYRSMEMLREELESVDWNAELKERAADEVQATHIAQMLKKSQSRITAGLDDFKTKISGWSEQVDARVEALRAALATAEAIQKRPHTDAESAEAQQAVDTAAEQVDAVMPEMTLTQRQQMKERLAGVSQQMAAIKTQHLERLKESEMFKWFQDWNTKKDSGFDGSSEAPPAPVSGPVSGPVPAPAPSSGTGSDATTTSDPTSLVDSVKGWFEAVSSSDKAEAEAKEEEEEEVLAPGQKIRQQLEFKGVGKMYHVVHADTEDVDLWALDPAADGTYSWFDGFVIKPTALMHHFAVPTATSIQSVLERVEGESLGDQTKAQLEAL